MLTNEGARRVASAMADWAIEWDGKVIKVNNPLALSPDEMEALMEAVPPPDVLEPVDGSYPPDRTDSMTDDLADPCDDCGLPVPVSTKRCLKCFYKHVIRTAPLQANALLRQEARRWQRCGWHLADAEFYIKAAQMGIL